MLAPATRRNQMICDDFVSFYAQNTLKYTLECVNPHLKMILDYRQYHMSCKAFPTLISLLNMTMTMSNQGLQKQAREKKNRKQRPDQRRLLGF